MSGPLEFRVERDKLERMVSVDGDQAVFGRGSDCDVRLEDPKASRAHCRFERLGDDLFLVDLDSRNGTWVDGVRVDRRPMGPRDVVRIGSTTIRVAGGLAERLSGIESTQTQAEPRERGMLQTLLGVARTLGEEDRPEQVAALLVDAAVSLCRAERGFVFLLENGATSLALGRNFAREPIPAPEQKVSRTLLERAFEAERPLRLEDAASDGEFAGVASISDLGLRSLLAVPLRHRGHVLGMLLVDHRLASGAFREDDVQLLDGLASLAAIHLSAAEERRRAKVLQRKTSSLQRQLGKRVEPDPTRLDTRGGSGFSGIIGASPSMQRLYSDMERILDSEVPVLLEGESGTGKELVARALHFHGPRADKAFVVENCGALPDTLLESELFGHVKGAFTGATRDRKGRFEEADGGTLFLDEVGEMSEAMQSRLLRVLQEGEIRRVGDDRVRQVDVRVIAATNADLREAVAEGSFREDLYYRLRVLALRMPPLREREGDVRMLAEHYLALEASEASRPERSLSEPAVARLEAHRWPGNVRELRNAMRRLVLLGEGPVEADELALQEAPEVAAVGDPGPDAPLPDRIHAIEVAAVRVNRTTSAARRDCSASPASR